MTAIIDPHIHLFDLTQGKYEWLHSIDEKKRNLIAHSFCENDLILERSFPLAGFVHIEGGFDNDAPDKELANIDARSRLPHKCIGFAELDMAPARFQSFMLAQSRFKNFCGIRHILDGQLNELLQSPQLLSNLEFLSNMRNGEVSATNDTAPIPVPIIVELQLSLGDLDHCKGLCTKLRDFPNLRIIINHAASAPLNAGEEYEPWLSAMGTLSKLDNLFIKCSGWEMQNEGYGFEQIHRPISDLVSSFSESRLMFASNFPLCLHHSSYQQYWQGMYDICDMLGLDFKAMAHDNAARCYGFN